MRDERLRCKSRRVRLAASKSGKTESAAQMDKTTYAKITINDAGETEVRSLDVVSETRPGRRHTLFAVDVSQAIDRIEQESMAHLLRLREALLALHEDDRRGLWKTLHAANHGSSPR